MRLIADMIAFTVDEVPQAGTRSTSARTTSRRRARRRCRRSPTRCRPRRPCSTGSGERVPEETFPRVFGRISFFVNAGIRFVEEHAKLRAMGRLWEELGRERYGVDDERMLRFRYGVQVNSLGLTESQPENNIIRIVLEALGRDAWAATRAPARSSCPPGTRRSACRGRGTSSGRCGSSRSSPTRPTCSSTPTSSRARR